MTVSEASKRYLAAVGHLRGDQARVRGRPARLRRLVRRRRARAASTSAFSPTTRPTLGRARPGGKLAPATISRRLSAVRSLLRFSLGPRPRAGHPAGPAPRPAASGRAEGGRGRRAARRRSTAASPLALRNRALLELVYSAGLRSAEAVGLDLADVDFEQEHVHVRDGKGAQGPRDPARRGGRPLDRAATSVRRGPSSRAARRTRSSCRPAAAASTRRRSAVWCRIRIASATLSRRTCWRAAPTCASSRSSSATRRSRRRRSTAT